MFHLVIRHNRHTSICVHVVYITSSTLWPISVPSQLFLAQSRQFHFFFIRQATPDDSELARGRPNGFHCSVESFFRVLTGREVPILCPPSDFPGPTDVVLPPRGTKNSKQSFEHSLACQTFVLSQPGNGLAVLTRLSRRSTHQSTALFSARRPLQRPQSQSLPPGKPCLFNSFETLAFPTARRDGDTTRGNISAHFNNGRRDRALKYSVGQSTFELL